MKRHIVSITFAIMALVMAKIEAQTLPPNTVKTCSKPLTLPALDGACGKASGVTACGPTQPTDSVYAQLNGTSVWVAFSTLTPTTLVADCKKAGFTAYSTYTTPVQPPPPPTPTHDYSVAWSPVLDSYLLEHSPDGGKTWDTPQTVALGAATTAIFKALPSNIQQCFRVTSVSAGWGNSLPTQSCIPALPATVVQGVAAN